MGSRALSSLLAVSTLLPAPGCISGMGCVLEDAREGARIAESKAKTARDLDEFRDLLERGALLQGDAQKTFVTSFVEPRVTSDLVPNVIDVRNVLRASADDSRKLLELRDAVPEPDPEADDKKKAADDNYSGTETHFGVRWGFGPAIVGDGTQEVESAVIEDGKVRVTKSRDYRPKILLETHKFLWAFRDCDPAKREERAKAIAEGTDSTDTLIGFGPFVALSLGGNEVIDGIGFGLMIGGQVGKGSTSFNIGVGPYLASEVQVLADGYVDGEDAPAGATEVELETRSDWKTLVMFSFSWSF